jgi:hypothetical protein
MKKLFILFIVPVLIILAGCNAENSTAGDMIPGGSGQSGSLARFTIIGDHLVTVNPTSMLTFSISDPSNINKVSTIQHGRFAETIFPLRSDVLLVGTSSGMLIYNFSTPENPALISIYEHITACDPVVASGNLAYLTLREETNTNMCNRGINRLEIIDISNLSAPSLIKDYPMTKPYGLGLANDSLLFLCDDGLKLFNVSESENIQLLRHFSDYKALDVIVRDPLVIVLSAYKITQYGRQGNNLSYLSEIH